MILRVSYLLTILLISLLFPWWVTVLLVIPYLFIYRAYEVPVFMLCVDGYYGTFYTFPVLSFAILGLAIMIEAIKPYLSLQHNYL